MQRMDIEVMNKPYSRESSDSSRNSASNEEKNYNFKSSARRNLFREYNEPT
jgi:hypothetical protein